MLPGLSLCSVVIETKPLHFREKPWEAVTFLCLQVQKQGIKGTRAGMGLTSHIAQD